MWPVINALQLILISIWTIVCATLTVIFLMLTWSQRIAVIVGGKIWSRVLLLICGVRLKVKGLENIPPSKTFIYVANHESLLDIPTIFLAIPSPLFFIAKKELKKVPFMGWAMWAVGMIFIDRGNRESALQSMKEAGRKIRGGKNVISFPEGTRTRTGEVAMFRRGTFVLAKENGLPILPVAVVGARKILPRDKFSLRPGTIEVRIGKPVMPESFESTEADELASRMRQAVVDLTK